MRKLKMNNKKLPKDILKQYQEFSKIEGQIVDRVDYILRTIFSAFSKRLDYWYFYGAGEGEIGPIKLDSWMKYEQVDGIVLEPYPSKDFGILLKNEKGQLKYEWGLKEGFPSKWLTEDFEVELIQGVAAYKDSELQKKAKANAKREENKKKKAELVKTAKKKLSPAEKKALGI